MRRDTFHAPLAFVILCQAAVANAQTRIRPLTEYLHDVWQIEQGLPQNTVQAIAQTPDGYLWLGTQEGIVRFDGIRFTVFDRQRVSELRSNNIQALFADRDGALWIGTESGGALRLQDGRFTGFGKTEGLQADTVRTYGQDSNGVLWAGTFGGGLHRFDGRRFARVTDVAGSRVSSLAADSSGALWVGTYDAGALYRSAEHVTARSSPDGLPTNDVRTVSVDRTGAVWAGTRQGIVRYRDGRWTPVSAELPVDIVTALFEDRAGAMWIGTAGNGVFRHKDGVLTRFGVAEGLSAPRVRAIFQDREDNIWIGTEAGGLNRLRHGLFTTYGRQDGLSSDIAYAVFQDRAGAMWVGTQQNGLNRWSGDRFTNYSTADGLPSATVLSLAEAADGALWVGTEGGGIARYVDGRFRRLDLPAEMRITSAYALQPDTAGCMWVGSSGQGLLRVCRDETTRITTKDGLGSDIVLAVARGTDDAVWAGTYEGGLNRYRNGRVTKFTTADGLGSNTVFSIYPDSDGTIWIGTSEGGLSRLRNDKITTYTVAHGLASNTIFQILDDGRGQLWMSSNKGVSRVRKDAVESVATGRTSTLSAIAYGKADGMASAECNGAVQPAGWRSQDGRLWFPTIKGVAVVDPSAIAAPLSPPVHIDEFVADRRSIGVRAKDAPRLEPGVANIEVHYVGLNLATPDSVRYRYRLEGYDGEWIDAGTRRVAYYTHLGPGRYRFRVSAAHKDGLFEETGDVLVFSIRPHFYQTWWFYALCVVALIRAGVTGYDVRVRRIKRLAERLQALVDERTASLAEANQELQRLATLDSLTGVANRRRFEAVIDAEWRRGIRARTPLSCIMVDIDHFGAFNTQYGHPAGDECLIQIGEVLRSVVSRPGDLVARYGGEEFVVVMPESSLQGAQQIAETLRARVEELRIPHAASPVGPVVTVSAGVATIVPVRSQEPKTIVAAADQALYRAKRGGRNRVEIN